MRLLSVLAILTALALHSAHAADPGGTREADLAAKSAQVEVLRARAATVPSATTTSTLIEADNLLRQLREAPPSKRDALRSQLEAALGRLELEIDAAGRGKP